MFRPSQALRLFYISWTLVRNGLDDLLLTTHLFRPLHYFRWLMPWRLLRRRNLSRGERIRRTLEDLGPIFIKFGQILSTRRDLLPDDIALELAHLQDRVAPFPGSQARAIIEKAYGQPVTELFEAFDEQPMASASIAQVHAARLKGGQEVVIKVLRPDIEPVIRRDIGLMYILADKVARYWSDGRRLRPREVVAEFERTIIDELDLMREAASAAQLRRNFTNSPMLYIPEVHWPYARRNVLVMERIEGIPIGDMDRIREADIDLKRLAQRGVEIFFTQVFVHNFFHADMHPGNVFVAPNGQYLAVDFGIVGTLSPEDQRYLAENLLAFFKRDYRRVAALHVESGWVPPTTRVDEFESAIRTVCEPIFEKPLAEISFGQLLLRLFQTARRFNMEIQPQLVLLEKTLLNIEGLGRQIYPELDLWQTAKPFMERWMNTQVGPKSVLRRIRDNLPQWGEQLPELPGLLHKGLQHFNVEHQYHQKAEMRRLEQQIHNSSRHSVGAIIGGALLISAVLLIDTSVGREASHWLGLPLPSLGLGATGALLWLLSWPRRR